VHLYGSQWLFFTIALSLLFLMMYSSWTIHLWKYKNLSSNPLLHWWHNLLSTILLTLE
jgi:hypothetical protein